MKNAEQVTFGGSALDRAGEVRSNPDVIQSMKQASDSYSCCILAWLSR